MLRNFCKATFVLLFAALLFAGCNSGILYDQNLQMPEEGWYYKNRAAFDIELTDTTHKHNFFINLRVTPDYEYSNMYVLLYATGPKGDTAAPRRFDFALAAADGKWLGKGAGSVITFRLPIVEGYVPKTPGTYHFEIEQNMRTNTLKEVVNVGMAVEKGEEEF